MKFRLKINYQIKKPLLCDIIQDFLDIDIIWRVFYFEGVGKVTHNISLVELERKINNSTGMDFNTNDFTSIFCKLDDLQEFEVIGIKNIINNPIVKIILIDSTFWEVELLDKNIDYRMLGELKKKYR